MKRHFATKRFNVFATLKRKQIDWMWELI